MDVGKEDMEVVSAAEEAAEDRWWMTLRCGCSFRKGKQKRKRKRRLSCSTSAHQLGFEDLQWQPFSVISFCSVW